MTFREMSIVPPANAQSLSPPSPLRLAVVGGGITGLAAAHRAIELCTAKQIPLELTLFEKQSRVGGVFGSEQVGEYLIERGADSFITNKPAALQLCLRLGLEDQLISTNPRFRRSLILHRRRPVPTPEGFHLMAPARMWPMWATPLLSWRGKLRLAAEPWVRRRTDTSDESLADFVRRRLGSEMLERIVQPIVGGIYTSDPERLSLQATLPRFPEMERKYGSLLRGMLRESATADPQDAVRSASGARYGLFASLKNGMQQLLDTLEQQIVTKTQRRSDPEVVSLQRVEQQWLLESVDGRRSWFDAVILTVPAQISARLLKPVHEGVSTQLRQFESASSAIVITGHSLAEIRHPLDAFGLVIPHREGRRILASSFLSRKFAGRAPEGKVLIRTFVGGAMQPEELEQSDDQLIETVLGELGAIFGVRGRPDVALVSRYPQGMPQYTVGHLERVAALESAAESLPRLQLAGNFLRGVGVPDCIQSGERAAEMLVESWTN